MQHDIGRCRNAQHGWTFYFIVVFAAWSTQVVHAVNYDMGTLNVTTFDSSVTLNGTAIPLTNADTLVFSGGTMNITGDGTAYSALLGSGTGAAAGFSWGPGGTGQSGGTINLSQDVTLSIDVAAGSSSPLTVISLTQTGAGTLNLTSNDTQNLTLTQNAGTLNVTGDVQTLGTAVIKGTMDVGGNYIANANSAAVETVTVSGVLNVAGEYRDLADQTNVSGTLTAQTANFVSGGLSVSAGGSFRIEDQAMFAVNTAILNYGEIILGDNSQLDSTTVADAGTMTVGRRLRPKAAALFPERVPRDDRASSRGSS